LKTKLILFLVIGIVFSCSQKPSSDEGTIDRDVPMEREPSELVILMQQMEAHILSLKKRQNRGDSVLTSDFIDYSGMLTLSTTKGVNRDALFENNAADWMDRLKKLTESPSADQEEVFNGLVSSCVDCHKNYCPGPIKRIEKLHI